MDHRHKSKIFKTVKLKDYIGENLGDLGYIYNIKNNS